MDVLRGGLVSGAGAAVLVRVVAVDGAGGDEELPPRSAIQLALTSSPKEARCPMRSENARRSSAWLIATRPRKIENLPACSSALGTFPERAYTVEGGQDSQENHRQREGPSHRDDCNLLEDNDLSTRWDTLVGDLLDMSPLPGQGEERRNKHS